MISLIIEMRKLLLSGELNENPKSTNFSDTVDQTNADVNEQNISADRDEHADMKER